MSGARIIGWGLCLGSTSVAVAQPEVGRDVADSISAQVVAVRPATGPVLSWRHLGVVSVGVAGLLLVDGPTQSFMQDRRSSFTDALADGVRGFGEWPAYVGGPVALTLVGLLAGNGSVANTGLEMAGAALVTMAVVLPTKRLIGRERPNCVCGSSNFAIGGTGRAMPSGHTAVAFAVLTALGDRIPSAAARVGLTGVAALVGWSRMNDDKHWLSDVAMGAIIGTVSARLVNGRWRLFGAGRPMVTANAEWTSVGWSLTF
ncbi:MAG: phosphatase PAP2 family protein [Gemmatimonadales bacterium]